MIKGKKDLIKHFRWNVITQKPVKSRMVINGLVRNFELWNRKTMKLTVVNQMLSFH